MPVVFFGASGMLAVLEWLAVFKRWRKVELVAKPGVIAALLVGVAASGELRGAMWCFALGLFFSMAGDVLLLFDHFFAGLSAFLLAHAAYVLGFNADLLPFTPLLALGIVLLVAVVAQGVARRVLAGLSEKGLRRMRIPVIAYTTCISLMVISALGTWARVYGWDVPSAFLVSLGALSFYASDGILAWNKFVTPMRYGRLVVMITYHLGQIAITVGALMHFG